MPQRFFNNEKGLILTLVYMVVIGLMILVAAFVSTSISEKRISDRQADSLNAFYIADGGIDRALAELKQNYDWIGASNVALGSGEYSVNVTAVGEKRKALSTGFVPSESSYRRKRMIEAIIQKTIPAHFYDNAIYSAGNVVINGGAYDINGNIYYGGDINISTNPPPPNVDGTVTGDSSINPLALLDFDQLRVLSQSQGNYHDAAHLSGPFPSSFWYDQAQGIPNIVFLEGSLNLTGHSSVGGFFVVGGAGEVTYDATLGGNVSVDGTIYTRGNFTIKGGGSALNVSGGVWVGDTTTLNGNAKINYNLSYMEAIQALGINAAVQIFSWREM